MTRMTHPCHTARPVPMARETRIRRSGPPPLPEPTPCLRACARACVGVRGGMGLGVVWGAGAVGGMDGALMYGAAALASLAWQQVPPCVCSPLPPTRLSPAAYLAPALLSPLSSLPSLPSTLSVSAPSAHLSLLLVSRPTPSVSPPSPL